MSKSSKRLFSLVLSLIMILAIYTPVIAVTSYATGVVLPTNEVTLYLGSASNYYKNVTATVTPSDYSGTYVWESSDISVVTVSGSSQSATVTAVATGTANVTVKVKNANGENLSASMKVNVIIDSPAYIEITAPVNGVSQTVSGTTDGISVRQTTSVQLSATKHMKSGEDKATTFTWSASNPSVVNTDSTGNVTGVGLGTGNITATDTVDNISATVKCYSYKIDKIEISGPDSLMVNGPSGRLTATITTTPSVPNISREGISWLSDQSGSGRISLTPSGSDFAATVKALDIGNVKVTCSLGGVTSDPFLITVTNYTATTPVVTYPGTSDQTEFYIIKDQAQLPTLHVIANSHKMGDNPPTMNFQWYKSNYPQISGDDTSIGSGIIDSYECRYTIPSSDANAAGTCYYYCAVTETDSDSNSTSTPTYSPIFKVVTKEPYDVVISGDTDNTIVIGTPEKLNATVYKNSTNSSFKLTQSVVSNPSITWTSSSPVLTLTEAGTQTTATGTAPIELATITAKYQTYTGQKTTKVAYNNQVNATAVVTTGSAPYLFGATNKDTSASIVDQLKNTNSDIKYIQFTSFTNTYGTLSTSSKDVKYYLSTPINAATTPYYLSDIKYAPGGKVGTDVYGYNAFNSENALIASGKISVEVKDDFTNTIDVAYSVKKDAVISLDENDFIKWFLSENTQYASLTNVVFTSNPEYGAMYATTSSSANASVGSSEYYTSNGRPENSSNYRLLSGIHYKGTNVGTDKISFSAQGIKTNGSIATEEGTLYLCVTNGQVSDINYSLKYGSNATMSETDFSNVYKNALGVSAASQFSIRILSVPEHVTLYRYGTENNSYKIYASQPTNLYVNNSDENSSYNVRNVICVPSSVWTGPEYSQYAVYDSSGVLKYVGKIAFSYDSAQQKFACGAEGYTFKISDFVSANDADPIISVSFTPLADTAAGKLYYNYKNGKGNLVNSTSKYTTTTGGSITSVTYIPKASSLISQKINYNAETRSGKQVSGDITITYINRYSTIHFSDVSDSWAIPAVDYVSEWDISNGTGGSKFNPNGTMQRAMLVTMLYRIAGNPSVSGVSNPFKDVSSSAYYYNAVLWAYSNNIVKGTSAKTFSPTAAVSRQDIATMLYRYAGTPTVSSTSNVAYFRDSGDVSNYAMNSISWAISEGIMSGSNNRLTPTSSGTRAQVAAMLHRYLTN